MGYYVNPRHLTKGEWLEKHATPVTLEYAKGYETGNSSVALLVMVDNGPFVAIAVAYSNAERDEFLNPDDLRPKAYFLVNASKLNAEAGLPYGYPGHRLDGEPDR